MSPFEYGPRLQPGQIRLLQLEWHVPNKNLKGRLVSRKLVTKKIMGHSSQDQITLNVDEAEIVVPEPGEYHAISYTWEASLPDSHCIELAREASDEYRVFPIKSNLHAILSTLAAQVQGQFDSRFLWVDAICIYQNDLIEKSHQIPLMSQIYGYAKHVIIWLGEETEMRRRAIQFTRKILAFEDFDSSMKENPEDWYAFCSLMKEKWFNRRWIIQEIAFAKGATIYCGSIEIEWDLFADAVSLVSPRSETLRKLMKGREEYQHHPDKIGDLEKLGASWLAHMVESLFYKTDDGTVAYRMLSLEALMSDLTLFRAGDPRDTLYAIVWMANDVQIEGEVLNDLNMDRSRPGSPETASVTTPVTHGDGFPAPGDDADLAGAGAGADSQHGFTTCTTSPPREAPISFDRPRAGTIPDQGPTKRKAHHSLGTDHRASGTPGAKRVKVVYGSHLGDDHDLDSYSKKAVTDDAASTAISYVGKELTIAIDYRNSPYQVCKDFITHVFGRRGYIDMMCRPWAPSPTSEPRNDWDPPSWMMLLDDNRAFQFDEQQVLRRIRADPLVGPADVKQRRRYMASGQRRAFKYQKRSRPTLPHYPPDIKIKSNLTLKGLLVGTVLKCSEVASDGSIPPEWLRFGRRKDDLKTNLDDPDFWRILVANRGLDTFKDPPRRLRMGCEVAFRNNGPSFSLNTTNILTHDKCQRHVAEFVRRAQEVVWGRLLMLVKLPENEHDESSPILCLGPKDAQKDDKVCILYGCSVPVVLRRQTTLQLKAELIEADTYRGNQSHSTSGPSRSMQDPIIRNGVQWDDEDEWYRFIGEAYVHNRMNGEIFSHKRKFHKKLEACEEDFEIR